MFGEEAYPGLPRKVAALFHSIAPNHAFIDGNKRAAVVAAIHMLNWNGYDLVAEQSDVVDIALLAAEGQADVEKLAECST